jgi:hypothetical protein
MSNIVIIINAEVNGNGQVTASPVSERMVKAFKKAISHHSPQPRSVEVLAAASLWSKGVLASLSEDSIYCPLTIQLPPDWHFPQQKIYQTCADLEGLRELVQSKFGYPTTRGQSGLGHLWLPIVLTSKGPLYGEVIGETEIPNSYLQPIDLPDYQRQGLYHLGYQLMESLAAPPSVYLLQFSCSDHQVVFDRLWPFPAAPALASVGKQTPDLFACHWFCLNKQPVKELAILGFSH